jgi:hypothetical protein
MYRRVLPASGTAPCWLTTSGRVLHALPLSGTLGRPRPASTFAHGAARVMEPSSPAGVYLMERRRISVWNAQTSWPSPCSTTPIPAAAPARSAPAASA